MEQDTRTGRTERLIGAEGVKKLQDSRVMVIGLGGVGSNCCEALARGGIGSFVLIDSDHVQKSNINRQAIAFESTIGKPKTQVMAAMIEDINPQCTLDVLNEHILPDDADALIESMPVDYCIDAQDTIMTKLALAKACIAHGVPLISSMGAANTFDPMHLAFADIYETHDCPLSRIVRKKARQEGIERLCVLYNPEHPAQTRPQEGAQRFERSDLGTMSYMPAIMGQMLAARVLCDLLDISW